MAQARLERRQPSQDFSPIIGDGNIGGIERAVAVIKRVRVVVLGAGGIKRICISGNGDLILGHFSVSRSSGCCRRWVDEVR